MAKGKAVCDLKAPRQAQPKFRLITNPRFPFRFLGSEFQFMLSSWGLFLQDANNTHY